MYFYLPDVRRDPGETVFYNSFPFTSHGLFYALQEIMIERLAGSRIGQLRNIDYMKKANLIAREKACRG